MSAGSTTEPIALVTGAASGIGAEVAQRLRRRGYAVVAVDRTEELAAVAAAAVDGESVACDLADRAALAELCERIEGGWGRRLEVVVANAGVVSIGTVEEGSGQELDLTIEVNLRAATHVIRSAVRAFSPGGRGHALATVSMGGILAMPGSAAYAASKAGLRAFLASLNAELGGTDIRVSGIYPSAVDTPMLRHEARNGGSPLNFVGDVLTVDAIADAYEKALDTGRLEVYAPYSDSVLSRLAMLRPAVLPRLLGPLNRIGERGRRAFLAEIGDGA
ncbi:MAG: SDR family oxidoreductase [Actinomycetota bacterium]